MQHLYLLSLSWYKESNKEKSRQTWSLRAFCLATHSSLVSTLTDFISFSFWEHLEVVEVRYLYLLSLAWYKKVTKKSKANHASCVTLRILPCHAPFYINLSNWIVYDRLWGRSLVFSLWSLGCSEWFGGAVHWWVCIGAPAGWQVGGLALSRELWSSSI